MATKARDAFRTISEVADWLDVPAHVLRFWESKFSQIKPVKRAGGRRYYRPDDMELIGGIKKLLHDDGMTIRGVQKMLKEDGIKVVSAMSPSLDGVDEAASPRTLQRKAAVRDVEDAVEETTTGETPADDDPQTLAAWDADAETDQSSAPQNVPGEDTTVEPADQEPEDIPEAPFIDVVEEPQFGGDNILEMSPRPEPEDAPEIAAVAEPEAEAEAEAEAEPEPEPEPEPEEIAATAAEPQEQPQTDREPAESGDTPVSQDPEPEAPIAAEQAVEELLEEERATPAPDAPARLSPEAVEENFRLSEAQLAVQVLKRKLRGTHSSELSAQGLAPHVARLQALRDRLARDLSGQ